VYLVKVQQHENNTNNVSTTRVEPFFITAVKRVKHWLSFISKGIFDQIFIALYLSIFAREFERDFRNANC